MNRQSMSVTDASVASSASGASPSAVDRELHVDFKDLMLFVQAIKGAAASVLWALMFTRIPMTNGELQDWTGYSAKSITDATRVLIKLGWVTSYSRFGPWSVTAKPELRAIRLPRTPDLFAQSSGISEPSLGIFDASIGISDASTVISASSSSSSTYLESTNPQDEELLLEAKSTNSWSEFPSSRPDFAENLRTLIDAGIGEPAASMLASLPHVTPAYVRAHVEQVLAEGQKLGAAIYRMRRGWLPPTRKRTRQAEVVERIRRFAEGE